MADHLRYFLLILNVFWKDNLVVSADTGVIFYKFNSVNVQEKHAVAFMNLGNFSVFL